MKVYYYIPAANPYSDIKIIDVSEGNELISYAQFKSQYKEALHALNFNFPNKLLKTSSKNSAILSFYTDSPHNKKNVFFAQTMICGKDSEGRSVPVTKVLFFKNRINKGELYKLLLKGNPDIEYPNYEFDTNQIDSEIMKFLNDKNFKNMKERFHVSKVEDWNKEQSIAFSQILVKYMLSDNIKSGKSMILNKSEIKNYDAYRFYYIKKKINKVTIALVISFIIMIILITILLLQYFNTNIS